MGFRARFAAIVVAVAAWGVWIGWRRYTLAFLPDYNVVGHIGYVYDQENGRHIRLAAAPAFMVAGYPVLLLMFLGVMVIGFRGHVQDIKIGWRAFRERPVVVGLWTAVLAVIPACCLTIGYAYHVNSGNVSFTDYLAIGYLADVPMAVTIFGVILVATVYLVVIGPWMIDLVPRMIGWLGMLRMFNGGKVPESAAWLARLEEDLATRPYRNQLVVTVMAQMQAANHDNAESVDDAMLRTMTLIPGLEEPSLLHVFSPGLYDLDARCAFAETLVNTYARTDSRAHLDVAIRLLDGIRRRPPLTTSRRRRAEIGLTLADALRMREEPGDLAEAHELVERAARVLPDRARRMRAVLLLADGSDLDEAITIFREHDGDELRLATALLCREERGDLEEALGYTRGLLAERGEDDPDVLTVHLAVLWHLDDAPELPDALDRVAALTDPPWELAYYAAMVNGFRAFESGDADGAMTYLDQALRLLVQAASLGLSRADRQSVLRRTALSPADVATIALMAGRVERAVELLELGRTVIWWQVRELRRAGAGEHAPRLAEIRSALQRPNYSETQEDQDVLAVHRKAVSRAELAREWDSIVQRQAFGHEIRFAELREAARGGPVVLVTTSAEQCDAIIVLAEHDPIHVPLPDLTEQDATAWAEGLLHAEARRMNARAIAPRLWDTVAAPVLAAVEPHLGADRRLWWCPTGALTSVPMHLAARNGSAVLDRVVSSYTPSLWSLLDARRNDRPRTAEPTMLITSLHDTPPRPDGTTWAALPHADQEAGQIAARIPAATRLAEQEATVEAVRAALPGSTWAHFASHGDLSGLVLHDGSLGIDELAGIDLGGNEVAFLSACVTAVPDSQNLDEALHPAAALHLQGFSHVIGTLWHIRSEDGPVAAGDFYARLLDDTSPALALHQAQQRLRSVAPDDPARWAPFVHIGP